MKLILKPSLYRALSNLNPFHSFRISHQILRHVPKNLNITSDLVLRSRPRYLIYQCTCILVQDTPWQSDEAGTEKVWPKWSDSYQWGQKTENNVAWNWFISMRVKREKAWRSSQSAICHNCHISLKFKAEKSTMYSFSTVQYELNIVLCKVCVSDFYGLDYLNFFCSHKRSSRWEKKRWAKRPNCNYELKLCCQQPSKFQQFW